MDEKESRSLGERAWKAADADALEARAEAIDRAILGLSGLNGMFEQRELGAEIASMLDKLEVEGSNFKTRAAALRGDDRLVALPERARRLREATP